jgi:hypothetical protein
VLERVLLLATALTLSLPIVHFVVYERNRRPRIDFGGPAWHARLALIERAQVFVRTPDIPALDLSRTPYDPAPLDPDEIVECRYVPRPATATTAKFDCRLPAGDVIKVKYGWTAERPAEVAATRLLAALGFGADHVTLLPRLRCLGCPPYPYQTRRLAESFFATSLVDWIVDDDAPRDFVWVSAERKLAGRAIEVDAHEGWDWNELDRVNPARGGASRADVDALRLMAIVLAHWDNKATNQRLVCEPGDGLADPQAPCRRPLLMLQDLGATFGPTKVRYDRWAETAVWADAARCTVSLEDMPYRGGHFRPIEISEGGRALLGGRLRQLSEAQIQALFQSAGFPDPATGRATGDVTAWVRTFRQKVRDIADRPPCPAISQ